MESKRRKVNGEQYESTRSQSRDKLVFNADDSCEEIQEKFYIILKQMRSLEAAALEKERSYNGVTNIEQLMDEIKKFFLSMQDSQKYSDKPNQILRLLDMLSFDLEQLVRKAPKVLYKTVNCLHLHESEYPCLMDWMHSFCHINSTLLFIASLHQTLPKSMLNHQVLQFSGSLISNAASFQTRITFRILLQYLTLHKSSYIHSSFVREEEDMSNEMILPCECFHQLYTSARNNLVDAVYWDFTNSLVTEVVHGSKQVAGRDVNDELNFKNPAEAILFCWWWLLQQKLPDKDETCQQVITRLVKMSLAQCDDEELSRVILIYTKLNSTQDSTSPSTLHRFDLLWNFFARKISNPKDCRSNGDMKSYSYEVFTPAEWIDHIDKLCRGRSVTSQSSSSFAQFLTFLIGILEQPSAWEPLKDKFYSRLECINGRSFDESMLTQFFTIILILLKFRANIDDGRIWNCCKTVLNSTTKSTTEHQKRGVIINGLFSIIHYFVEHSRKFTLVSVEMKEIITKVINNFTNADKTKTEERNKCWKVIVSYIDNLNFVIQHSNNFSLGQVNLVPSEVLKRMLGNSRNHELSSFLLSFSHILATLRSRGKELSSDSPNNDSFCRFVAMFSAFLIGWLRKTSLVSVQSYPHFSQIVCDLACLTLTHVKDDRGLFEVLWNKFGSECVDLPVKTHSTFLVYFVTTTEISDALNDEYKNSNFCVKTNRKTPFCDVLVQGWFRCMLASDLGANMSTELQEFNRAFGSLNVIRNVVEGEDIEEINFNNFLQCLSSKHKRAQNFLSRVRWSDATIRWCFSLVKIILRQLIQHPAEVVYYNLSLLMFHCSTLLYTAGKPSVVTEMLSHLMSITRNQRAVNCLQHCLHKFIIGILPIAQTCVNIRRTLKTIINNYLKLYPCSGEHGKNNPFLKLLIEVGPHLDTCLSVLYDSVADKQEDQITTKLIEILHKWLNKQSGEILVIEDTIAEKFQTFLQRFKHRYHLNVINSEKVDFLISYFRNLVEIPSSLDLFQD